MPLTGPFIILPDTEATLAESPVWDDAVGALLWVDIPRGTIHERLLATGAHRHWTLEGPVGSIGLCRSGRLIVARRHEVGLFDRATGAYQTLAQLLPPGASQRLNDGKPGPDGAFWVGGMDETIPKQPLASLYRVAPDGTVTVARTGLRTSNGLAWSPDGRTMFHADTSARWIERGPFDPATGARALTETVATPTESEGRPDGAAVDAAGFYWSAGVSAGVLNRYAPDFSAVTRIQLPVAAPTCPCFAGPDLRTLIVASRSPSSAPPNSGCLIAAPVSVPGAPVARMDI